ncbi:DMT family transporter [Aliiglaciecola sp. M165]|uniref:DMT family transporter n=1 Tax=Aliiglaciecola sp. M165 TaxID=2593649 RepID=UPI00163D9814|nr:DMT family transporter [Aliiglaciecola sp. M165]
MMPQSWLFILMLFAGVGIPIMAALNAGLGEHINNPIAAVTLLATVALVSSITILVVAGKPIDWKQFISAPPLFFVAGILFVFYIGSITHSAPKIGLGNAVLMVLIGQLVCSVIIDHYGLLGVQQLSITLRRLAGLGSLAIGFWLVVIK